MAYQKQEWRNNDLSTPLSAERLLYMEEGIAVAHSKLTPTGGEPHTDNAAYIEMDEFLSIFDGDVSAAVAALQSDGITQPLIDMGTVNGTGTLITPAAFDTAAGAFLDYVLTHDTGLRPIATINGTHWNGTNLTPAIRTKIASEALRMVWDYGFSGVQIDFEPYSTQIIDGALIPLLQEIRTTLPAQHPISVALPTYRSGNITTAQIGQMAQVVDMLNPMIYDTLGPPEWGETTIQTAEEYQQLYRAEIDAYQTGIGAAAGKLVPIVPAYNDLSMPVGGGDPGFPDPNSGVIFYHLHEVENISVAMAAVHEAITIDGHAIDSLAVFWYPSLYYAGFEADRAVWEGWVNPGAPAKHTHTVSEITDLPEIRSSAAPDSLVLRSPTGNVLVANTPSGPSAATSRTYVETYVASQLGEAGTPIVPVEELPANPAPGTFYAVMGPGAVPEPTALATYQMVGTPTAGQDFPGTAVPSSFGFASNPGGWYAGASHGLTPPVAGLYTIKVTADPANGPVSIYPYVNGAWATSIKGTGDTATATLQLTTSDAVYYDVVPTTGGVPVTVTVKAYAGEV